MYLQTGLASLGSSIRGGDWSEERLGERKRGRGRERDIVR